MPAFARGSKIAGQRTTERAGAESRTAPKGTTPWRSYNQNTAVRFSGSGRGQVVSTWRHPSSSSTSCVFMRLQIATKRLLLACGRCRLQHQLRQLAGQGPVPPPGAPPNRSANAALCQRSPRFAYQPRQPPDRDSPSPTTRGLPRRLQIALIRLLFELCYPADAMPVLLAVRLIHE